MTIRPGAFPDTVSEPVRQLLETFYRLSNAASSHNEHEKDEQKLVDLFTPDGVYEFAGTKNKGAQAILGFRKKLFNNVAHRDHPVVRVYSFGTNDRELLALGEVEYRHPNGKSHTEEWAGRYSIVQDDAGALKFQHVQIILASFFLTTCRQGMS
ncbi:hypothetical protein MFIFM68171_08762 [Madurella fahalii]|uniref:SnoaL-like domain-containing protein n=1 Tax=Madurella fahalii TaxID=1157608 RepID=A0ABQ0GLA7_9PEZI